MVTRLADLVMPTVRKVTLHMIANDVVAEAWTLTVVDSVVAVEVMDVADLTLMAVLCEAVVDRPVNAVVEADTVLPEEAEEDTEDHLPEEAMVAPDAAVPWVLPPEELLLEPQPEPCMPLADDLPTILLMTHTASSKVDGERVATRPCPTSMEDTKPMADSLVPSHHLHCLETVSAWPPPTAMPMRWMLHPLVTPHRTASTLKYETATAM